LPARAAASGAGPSRGRSDSVAALAAVIFWIHVAFLHAATTRGGF
jgi:hypothetical protein